MIKNIYLKNKLKQLPTSPGVYFFYDEKNKLIYIGKATSLKDRVGSYFTGSHDNKTEKLVSEIVKIKIKKTQSVFEALILESNLIKKNQPKYNIKAKDDKSFSYFLITKKDEFPRIIIVRETDLKKYSGAKIYGPYTSKRQMELALRIIRKIFPFHSIKEFSEKKCFDFQLGLCPGPYAGKISRQDYLKNIRRIELIFQGKKSSLVTKIKKEMTELAKKQLYEKARELRDKIFALEHIRDVALIGQDEFKENLQAGDFQNIEGYDISNLSGDYAVGSMVSFLDGRAEKKNYRRFKIKLVEKIDDVGMMKEVLARRLKRAEWPTPDLIILDGGKGHLNMAVALLKKLKLKIPILAVAKGPTRKKLDLYSSEKTILVRIPHQKIIEQVRDEAHRFAISYHKKLRKKEWLKK